MKSLLETLNFDWDKSTENSIEVLLDKLLKDYKNVNYYELMNVTDARSDDNIKTIKDTYKTLSRKIHPDKTSGKSYQPVAAQLFLLVKEAYQTLTDPNKERVYRLTLPDNSAPFSFDSFPPQPKHSSSASHTFYSAAPSQSFNFFSSGGSTSFTTYSDPAPTKTYHRDINANEALDFKWANIVVIGKVYGKISTLSGDISITGDVYGSVSTQSGGNTVKGNVYGSVSTASGDNKIKGNVYGNVSTATGNNKIKGDAPGNVTTMDGKNKIAGKPGSNNTGKSKSSTNCNVFTFNSGQMSSQEQQQLNEMLSSVLGGCSFKF
ncbi:MAG: DnaJ domain-containing protein [Legionella sp.]|nr:DnaJ domain-containing protein [Legionella sp.]